MMEPDGNRLFVYGTLVSPAERERLLGRAMSAEPARLAGFVRGQRKYFYVARDGSGVVDGAILSGLDERDFAILDAYEEVPALYTRERIAVSDGAGRSIECWIYLPTGWERE